MIEVIGVSKAFRKTPVLQEVSLTLPKGHIGGIVGSNGSGKTVLLKIICGLMKPDAGEVRVHGQRIGHDVDFPDSTGIIIEAPGFLPFDSGYKNLEYLASLRHLIGREEIETAMRTVGLDPQSRKRVRHYSLGMKQRLGLAQAIMEDPELLILDEPMNGLDKEGASDMRRLLCSFREAGKTILLVSHHADDIDSLCDTVWEMEHGQLHAREEIT